MVERTEEMKKSTVDFYDNFSSTYCQRHAKPPEDSIRKFTQLLKGWDILDLGCGGGRDGSVFRLFDFKPVCVDLSSVMCKKARENHLPTVQMDQERLCFKPESFDGVWSRVSLLHSPPEVVSGILADLRLILKPRGVLFLGMKTSVGKFVETEFKTTENGSTYYCYWPPHHLLGLLETLGFTVGEMSFYGKDFFNERNYFEIFAVKS